MDPLSQAVFGANLSQCFTSKKHFKVATLAGVLGGLFPDIDVLIRSSTDPLLALQFHRHFTHSLFMVAPMALPVALFVWLLFRKSISFKYVFFYAFLGVLTHGLLDSCTSYGTQLLWPFSTARIAWNNISIIDPLLTIPALVGVIWADRKKNRRIAHGTFVFMILYLLFGVYQRDLATKAATEIAKARQHIFTRIEAKPSMGNLFLWRTLYETPENIFYVDAIHVGPGFKPKIYPGNSIAHWSPDSVEPKIPLGSVLEEDIQRFDWFSDRYLVKSQAYPLVIGDLRYATLPNSLEPLWGISFDPQKPNEHIAWQNFRSLNKEIRDDFKKMLFRND